MQKQIPLCDAPNAHLRFLPLRKSKWWENYVVRWAWMLEIVMYPTKARILSHPYLVYDILHAGDTSVGVHSYERALLSSNLL